MPSKVWGEYEATRVHNLPRRSGGRLTASGACTTIGDANHRASPEGMPVTSNRGRQAVKGIAKLTREIAIVAVATLIGQVPAPAGTFVYVSNAEDGDIAVYSMQADGSLKAGERAKAAKLVMPMAVSPDRRFLYAASRSETIFGVRLCDRPQYGRIEEFVAVRRLPRAFPIFRSTRPGVICSARRMAPT